MSDIPVVSVIMPVHNGAEHLREAIDSVLHQSLTRLELIVIDDGSTDESAAILDWYEATDDRVRVFHQENMGVASALNKGLAEARGKYIARMDSDDICACGRLAKQIGVMRINPEIGICGTGWSYLGKRHGVIVPRTTDADIRASQLFWPSIAHPTVMVRRELLVKHDLRYDTEFKQAEDYEFWNRLSLYCKMANIPEPLLRYRVRDEQATSMYESDVHKWSSLVHKRAICALGIEPSEEDLEIHGALAGASIPRSFDCLQRAEAWLLKLTAANQNKHIYDEESLRRVFFECWYSFCSRAAELGVWSWPAFGHSKLINGFGIPARYGVSFAARYVLRSRTRAAYYKLSRFDSVWKSVATLLPRTATEISGDAS